jgi:hypothetical protein
MEQKGGLYADVEVKVIDDRNRPESDPTRSNVEKGLYWLQHAATTAISPSSSFLVTATSIRSRNSIF